MLSGWGGNHRPRRKQWQPTAGFVAWSPVGWLLRNLMLVSSMGIPLPFYTTFSICPLIMSQTGILVLVKTRQRAVLITPVCPMSYGRSTISRLLKISSEPASATAAVRLFQTGIVRWTIEYLRRFVRARFSLNLWQWASLVLMSATSNPKSSVVTTTSPFMAL